MSSTVTGTFESIDQARNVEDDLLASGIPSESIYIDEPAKAIRVLMPEATRATVVEILERHRLQAVTH